METSPESPQISLSPLDLEKVNSITALAETVPEEIRTKASTDIIRTIQNGHPLNRLWRNEQGELIGYLAFEDFEPNEAYIKYFSTEGLKEENPFRAISGLIEKARSLGYKKLHFHGFNPILNHILEHFGFRRTHSDSAGGHEVDHLELKLVEEKPKIDDKTREAFEQKYVNHLIEEIDKTAKTLDEEKRQKLEQINRDLIQRLSALGDFVIDDKRKLILKLKLARYLQRHDSVDENTLADAIIESPKWLDKDKGGF
ncbi:MAG: hypothetical protein WC027_03310, partial [Candidatus Paceibacterota bacterium]